MLKVKYNAKFLDDPTNMDLDSLRYFVDASAFLYEYLHHQGLNDNFHTLVLYEWLHFFDKKGFDQITPESFTALLDILAEKFPRYASSSAGNTVIDTLKDLSDGKIVDFQITKFELLISLIAGRKQIDWTKSDIYKAGMGLLGFIYGPIGAFIYFNKGNTESQFKKEFIRLLAPDDSITSNSHLFFLAYWFARNGYQVSFVDEGTTKTPDLVVSKAENKFYVEANAKRSATSTLNRMVEEAIVEKKQKFNDIYKPGIIAVDVGVKDLKEIKAISVKRGIVSDDALGRNVNVFNDANFYIDPINASLSGIINIFKGLDASIIPYLLITQSNLLKLNSAHIENPIDIISVADKSAKPLLGIAKTNYWV